jgi:hypothetical protein
MRRGIAIAGALCAVLVVSGCTPRFEGKIKGKQISENKVQVKFKVCQRQIFKNDCSTSARQQRGEEGAIFHLLAFRIPEGTGARQTFRNRTGELVYERSNSYGRELTDKAPTPNGTEWVGYISEDLSGQEPDIVRYKVKFRLPNNAGSKFEYRPVTGYAFREDKSNEPPAVRCGDSAFNPGEDKNANAQCITDPTKRRQVKKSKKIRLD